MSTARIAARAMLFGLVAPGTVTILVPTLIASSDGRSLPVGAGRFAGIPLIAAGASVLVWCFTDFVRQGRGTPAPWDAPTELVSRGMYRSVRNPMYVGIVTALLGESLLFRSAWLLAYTAGVWLMFHLFVTIYEEPHLRRVFGASYEAYLVRVPRWIPRRPFSPR